MSLRLIIGRAGTGKTRTCLDEITSQMKENPLGPPLIFIAPAQATFNMERELAFRGGSIRAQVYSFKRLAYRVLRETGGAERQPVSELGRRMLLKSILMEHKGNLNILGALHNRSGFLVSLSDIVGEFKICRISPGDLELLVENEKQSRLEMKLQDLNFVYSRLSEMMADKLTDPDDYLDLLAGQIPAANFLAGCRVWIDGYISFTPQEWAVIEQLLVKADEVTVTLCADKKALLENMPGYHPFEKSRETFDRIKRLAGKRGAGVEVQFLEPSPNPRFARAPELRHLERYFFEYTAPSYDKVSPKVKLMSGVNLRAEVEGAARAIRRLLRDEGMRLREIMIAVREVEVYFPLLRQLLADYDIPYFIDHTRPVMHHPLVELIRSALEVWQSNWPYEPVFRYLKSGLTRVSRDETDILENYVLAAGIRGSSWYNERPWHYVPRNLWGEGKNEDEEYAARLEEVNLIRHRAVKELRAAQLKMREIATGRPRRVSGREWAGILLELCLDLDIPRRLDHWSIAALEEGKPELSGEHRQIWKLLMRLLDEFVDVLGDTKLTIAEVAAVLDSGLEAVNFRQIPPGPDAVTVGSLERSLPPGDIKALFVLGLTEGALPANARRYGVLTENEREEFSRRLAACDRELLPGSDDRLHREQFLIYRVLTRTGGYLWLSYPLGDNEGRAVTPSPVFRRLKELFPLHNTGLLPAGPAEGDHDLCFAEHPVAVFSRMPLKWQEASWGRFVHPVWWQCYNLLLEKEDWAKRVGALVESFISRNVESPLGDKLAISLWGKQRRKLKVIPGSVSGLERFVKCPFSHFLSRGLRLKERVTYKLSPPDTGQLYHEALRRFVEYISTTGPGWDELQLGQVPEICSGLVDEVASGLQGNILLSSARFRRQKERLAERVTDSACALVQQVQASGLRPAALEVYFGPRGKGDMPRGRSGQSIPFLPELLLPPLELELAQGVSISLTGRIDRVDIGETQEGLYLSVIDYKSGSEKLNLGRVLAGEQLQLLVYLWVALRHFAAYCCDPGKEIKPAGAFYFRVQKPILDVENPGLPPEDLHNQWLRQFKLSGWLVDNGSNFFRFVDRNLGPGQASLVVPASLTKDGGISGRQKSSIYSPDEFKWLLSSLGELIKKIGLHLAGGRVDIAPLKAGQESACRFCPYGPVCRFDPWLPENSHRNLNWDNKDLRKRIEKEACGKGGRPFVLYNLD